MQNGYMTNEENEIIDKIPKIKIAEWAKKEEYWKIYKLIIQITRDYLESGEGEQGGKANG